MKSFLMRAILAAIALPGLLSAGEKEDALIGKITAAYGGDALLKLSNYEIRDRYVAPTAGQSRSPDLQEIGQTAQILTMDIKRKKVRYETWFSGRSGNFQGATISDFENAQNINYAAGTYGKAANADPYAFAGGSMRTADTVLVYELNKVRDTATIDADEDYLNRPHHILNMTFPQSPKLKLYVDAETYLLSKMVRVNPQAGNLDYVYANHKKQNGITYASSINFFVAGKPNVISTQHELSFNLDLPPNAFQVPAGLKAEGERIDTSEMRVSKISDRVYHVGKGNGYSLFVDTNIGVVAVGGYPALKARLEQFRKEAKVYKPLAYQIVTHHHLDHLGGLAEAIGLGARLVTVSANLQTIKDNVLPVPDAWNFLSVGPQTAFGDGRNRVEVYDVATIHAESFLVTYVPAEKLIFIADHMGSAYKKTLPVANLGTVGMLAALDALDLDIKQIATAHNARIFSMKEMRAAVAAYKPSHCMANRPICM